MNQMTIGLALGIVNIIGLLIINFSKLNKKAIKIIYWGLILFNLAMIVLSLI